MKMEIINIIIELAREAERNKVILEHNLAVNTAFKRPILVDIPGIPRTVNLNNEDFSNTPDEDFTPSGEHRSCKGCKNSETNSDGLFRLTLVCNPPLLFINGDGFVPKTVTRHDQTIDFSYKECEDCYDINDGNNIRKNWVQDGHRSCANCRHAVANGSRFEVGDLEYATNDVLCPGTYKDKTGRWQLSSSCEGCYDLEQADDIRRNWKGKQ